jgi:hypothetical protein
MLGNGLQNSSAHLLACLHSADALFLLLLLVLL